MQDPEFLTKLEQLQVAALPTRGNTYNVEFSVPFRD